MDALSKIQKSLKAIRILLIIAEVVCIVLTVLAAAASAVWIACGKTYATSEGFFATVAEALDFGGFKTMLGTFLADIAELVALTLMFAFSVSCIKTELSAGTPFTPLFARRVKWLGLLFFFVSLAAEMVVVIIREFCSLFSYCGIGIYGGMATGVVLMIMSSFIRCGTPAPKPTEKQRSDGETEA